MRLTFLLLVTTTTTTTSFCRAFVAPRQGQRGLGLLLHNSRNPFMLVDNGNYDRDADDEHQQQQQQQQHWRYSSRNEPWSWNEAAAGEFVNDGHHHHHYGSFQSNNRIRVPDKPASAYMTVHDEDDNDSFVDDFDDIIDDDEDDSVFGDVSSPAVNIFPQATTNDIDSFMSTQGHPGPPPFGMFLQQGHKSLFPESVINPKSTLPPPPPGLIPDWVTEKASLSSSSSSSYYDNAAHDNDWSALSSPRSDRVPGPPPYGMFLKEKQRQQQQEEEAVVDLFKDWTPPSPPQEAAEHYPGESSLPPPPPLHSSGPPSFGLFQQDEMEWANTFEDFDVFNHQNHHHDVEDDLPPLLHHQQQQQQQQHQQGQSMSIPTHPHESSFGIWEDALSLDPASELSFQHESSAEDTAATLRGPPPEGLYMQDVMELPTSHVHSGLSP